VVQCGKAIPEPPIAIASELRALISRTLGCELIEFGDIY
jgi:hypothetical protein